MEEQTVRQMAQEFIDALHALEKAEVSDSENALERLVSLYAEDAHLTNAALRLTGEEHQGTQEIHAFWLDYKKTLGKAYSDFSQVTVNNESAGLFWVTKGTDRDGHEGAVHYDGATLLVFDGQGKIRYFQGYYDTHQFNREMKVESH